MALPAIRAVRPHAVLVTRWLAPLVELSGFSAMPFDRGAKGFVRAVAELRRRSFNRGILLTPSFSSALMFRLGGVRMRRGTDTDHRGALLTSRIDPALLELQHRSTAYFTIATDDVPGERPVPWLDVPKSGMMEDGKQVRNSVGICPGSHAPSRTWPVERFAEVARTLANDTTVVVFGSPAERAITRAVAGDWAIDLGGKTDLPALASALAQCDVVISNDSGPLHLAAAVGTPTISLWGAGDPSRTGPPDGHRILRHTELPCLECVRNQCPRRGRGYILADAYNECLRLIEVDRVLDAARATVTG